jgi:type II secretory pathway pseudopilin PulG
MNQHSCRKTRRGVTLLELVIASAMLATIVGAVSTVLRGSLAAWEGHESDQTRTDSAHATMRHLVRQIRQSQSVSTISAATDNSGSLSVLMPSGETHAWDHNSAADEVLFDTDGSADQLLAEHITALKFVAYQADMTTATTTPDEIRAIRCTVTTQLDHEVGGTVTLNSWVWLRSW